MRKWLALAAAVLMTASLGASEPEQLKADLTGQTMGGREKCWKFQSPEQIKELVIEEKTEDSQRRVYVIRLRLEAGKDCGKYSAQARVTYVPAGGGWRLKQVGLLSLAKVH